MIQALGYGRRRVLRTSFSYISLCDQQSEPVSSTCRDISTSSTPHNSMSAFEAISMVASPSQLGASLLEVLHTQTGLPWWASIPATAIATRTALLPLTLKAQKASENLQLLNTSVKQAKMLTLDMQSSDAKALGRTELVKAIFRHHISKHSTPSMKWYWGNAVVQGAMFMTFTGALNTMSSAVWPGFTSGGPPGLADLTSPPVFLSTLSTPFGTLGAVLPLAIILLYIRGLDASRAAQVPGIGAAMRLMALPFYVLSLVQPHATLFYWLSHTATYAFLQPSSSADASGKDEEAAVDAALLVALGRHYSQSKPTRDAATAAVLCYSQAIKLLQKELGDTSKYILDHTVDGSSSSSDTNKESITANASQNSASKRVGQLEDEEETRNDCADLASQATSTVTDPETDAEVHHLQEEVELLEEAQHGLEAAQERLAALSTGK